MATFLSPPPRAGAYANATGAAFEPFLQPTLEALGALVAHSHRLVREHVCRALPLVLAAFRAHVKARGMAEAGAAQLAAVAGGVLARLAALIVDDPDVSTARSVAAAICASALLLAGPRCRRCGNRSI